MFLTLLNQWKAERLELVRQREKIDGQIADIEARINAGALLLGWPEEASSDPNDEFEAIEGIAENMPTAIVRVLTTATRSLTRAEIKGYLGQDEQMARRLDRTPNAFYNGRSVF